MRFKVGRFHSVVCPQTHGPASDVHYRPLQLDPKLSEVPALAPYLQGARASTMRSTPTLLSALALCSFAHAQPTLLPALNTSALPADGDPVCALPDQVPPIETSGRPEGETAADFTAYDLNGNAFDLGDALALGKPLLMIAASYTCPVFRNRIPSINNVVATYGSELTTVIVYTVEAHPYIDISPYFGAVNTHPANIAAGILYQQPTTYGERKAVAEDMLDSLAIDAPVYFDGPCNEWWNYYGQAPNCAYLIDTTGMIFAHHPWYDKFPEDIICDIDSLLGNPTDCDETFAGEFELVLTSNDTVYGDAGTTLYGSATLVNTTSSDCLVRMVKMVTSLPSGWTTSLCADVCYLPSVDTALVTLPANDSLHFYYYFYSGAAADTGYTKVGFRNEYNTNNHFDQRYWGITQEANGIAEAPPPALLVFPNPCTDILQVGVATPGDVLVITDAWGRQRRTPVRDGHVEMADLPPGLYGVCLESVGKRSSALVHVMKQ